MGIPFCQQWARQRSLRNAEILIIIPQDCGACQILMGKEESRDSLHYNQLLQILHFFLDQIQILACFG